MAEIVLMNAWRDRQGKKMSSSGQRRDKTTSPELAMAGEVVMFTGIRYERFDDRMDRKAENHGGRVELI